MTNNKPKQAITDLQVAQIYLTIGVILVALMFMFGCAKKGKPGVIGQTGPTGVPGSSCSVTQFANGAVIACTDGSTAIINNGIPGVAGTNGQDGTPGGIQTVEFINPCAYLDLDEILLKFPTGEIVGHYSHGSRQHLTVLTPHSYTTTDGYACNFTVNNDNTVTW